MTNESEEGSAVALGAWFEVEDQRALTDFCSVYQRHFERARASRLEWMRQRAELGPLLTRLGQDQFTEWERRRQELLRDPAQVNWGRYESLLVEEGAWYAASGVPLRIALDDTRTFMAPLLPALVDAYGGEPARLAAAVQLMNELAQRSQGLIAEAYLARKDANIRAREMDLATTLDSIGDAVIVTDVDGRITRMNPIAERLTGYSMSESLDRPLEEIFQIENEDTHEKVESPVSRVLREGTVVGLAKHTELVAKDGSRRPIADSGAPIRRDGGKARGVVLVFRDVTKERRAEQALRHWERIFQYATWGVATANIKDILFQAVNPAYAEMHGYTVEELVGAPVSVLWAPETEQDMRRHADETHHHGKLRVETTHLCKDGSRLPVEIVATTLKNGAGEREWFVANVQDITERREFQQAKIRAIELEAENRRILEASRLKGEFLANMSHELRTPLNSIIGFAQLLHDEQVGPLEAKQKEFLGDILSGGLHLLRLINDVLDLAKVEAGKMEFRPEPVDPAALVQSVVQALRPAAASKSIKVTVSVDPGLSDVVLDPGRFNQLLYNYLSNALKFNPDGGSVIVRLLPEGDRDFRVEVEDTGPGVAPAEVHWLFTPFQQLDSGSTRRHGGTGLGLALTKRLAEAQGGRVGMRPAPERGSIFFAVLPLRPRSGSNAPERRADQPKPTKVLVLEPDSHDRRVIVGILKDAGYEVDAVSNPAEALVAWKSRTYDALALSLLMEDRADLQQLFSQVRADRTRPDVPIIALTVVGESGVAASLAVTDVVPKPVDAAILLAALEHAGAAPTRGRPVLVVDDDHASLKLMEATLAKLGYDALCFSNAREALAALVRVRPLAVVLDLLMPTMDGFSFLEGLRASPDTARIPVMIWTVKDLSSEERERLQGMVLAIVQKGGGGSHPLSSALREFLPLQAASKGTPR